MDNLRWVLLAVGVLVVAGVYLFESRRRRLREAGDDGLDEDERQLLGDLRPGREDDDPFADLGNLRGDPLRLDDEDVARLGAMVPDAEPEEPVVPEAPPRAERKTPPRAAEPRVQAPASEPRAPSSGAEPRRGGAGSDLIIVLNVASEPGSPFAGAEVRAALESVDMRFGDMNIYHHFGIGDSRSERPVFSVANMLEPGTFDPARMDDFTTPGLVMFLRLPGPLDPRVAFELMLNTGQRLAEELGGELRDETRSVLGAQTIAHIRERISEFNRRQLLAAS
jgi:cell division protein ZipA